MNGARPGSELLDSIVGVARAIFGAQAASITLYDAETRELVFVAVAGAGADSLVGRRIPADAGIAGWVFTARQPLVVEDVASDPRFAGDVAQSTGYVPKGLMAAPLLGDDAALGVLSVLDRPKRTRFSLVEMDLLGLFASQAAVALEVQRRADAGLGPASGPVVALSEALDRLPPARRKAAEALVGDLVKVLER